MTETITVKVEINSKVERVWQLWNEPEHIMNWNHASDDWCAPKSTNNLVVGGKFSTTMAAKDGSISFDFQGIYTRIDQFRLIEYRIIDDRNVKVEFIENGYTTTIIENFDAEDINPIELQRQGWQAILNNFKKYVEARSDAR